MVELGGFDKHWRDKQVRRIIQRYGAGTTIGDIEGAILHRPGDVSGFAYTPVDSDFEDGSTGLEGTATDGPKAQTVESEANYSKG